MDPYFAATVVYPCPRCGIDLEARLAAVPDWLRCPQCGKGNRPPVATQKRTPLNVSKLAYDPDVLVIGEEVMNEPETPWYGTALHRPDRPARPPAPAPLPAPEASRTGLVVVFSLSLALFLVMLFVGDRFKAGLFGIAAGLLLLFLVRPARTAARP